MNELNILTNALTIALGFLIGKLLIVLFALALSTVIELVRWIIDKISELRTDK